MELSFQEALMP
uniref:Uncharacterized protein n=1 Tax=Rhizophora mucronata TaxID=61149 RepID=A0A2P2QYF1_RHIMU